MIELPTPLNLFKLVDPKKYCLTREEQREIITDMFRIMRDMQENDTHLFEKLKYISENTNTVFTNKPRIIF
jgi:hypothetical protein